MSVQVISFCDECGWAGRYTSRAKADFSYRQHSCTKKRRTDRAAARRRNREASTDRTPKPCLHKRTRHEHGTHACYVLDHCRCRPCLDATTAYERDRARQRAYGKAAFVDARPAAEHLRALSAAGMGWKRAAAAAGVPTSTVYPLLYGRPNRNGGAPRTKARAQLVDAILAIPLPAVDQLGATVNVDPTGTTRRLQALIALGWSISRLAADHDLNRQALDGALRGRAVQARTATAVATMFDRIGDRPAPETNQRERIAASRSRRRATEGQWAPPAMWDLEDLDNPAALPPMGYGRPGECTVTGCAEPHGKGMRLCWGHYNERRGRADQPRPQALRVDLDEWAFLVRGGADPAGAARRLGVTAKDPISTIDKLARRDNRPDILRLISQTRSAA